MLHGHASDAAQAATFASELDPAGRFHHVTAAGPIGLGDGTFAWFDDTPGSLARCGSVVRSLLCGLSHDQPAPVVVVGYSQGGAAALAAMVEAVADPAPGIAALAVVSGFLAEDTQVGIDLGRLHGLPVLVQHGEADEVVPAFLAEDLVGALRAAGVDAALDLRPLGHERDAGSVEALRGWLEAVLP